MSLSRLFVVLCLVAAVLPFIFGGNAIGATKQGSIDWPTHFEGQQLIRLELSQQEQGYLKNFPGEIARFTDGQREIIIRQLTKVSRRLHPASDCLKGIGFHTTPEPISVDAAGNHWGCFRAFKSGQSLKVCERIYDQHGGNWSDVSSWFWAAILGKSNGPWWAISVADPQ